MTKNLLLRSVLMVLMLSGGFAAALADQSLPDIEGIEIVRYKGLYDGKSHSLTVNGVQRGDIVTYSQDGDLWGSEMPLFTDVSAQKVFVKVDRYGFSSFVGADSVVITKRYVKIFSGDATKVYDGRPLTLGVVNVVGDGFANGECPKFIVTGEQTEVGTSANTFEIKFDESLCKADNYSVEKSDGTLSVTYIGGRTLEIDASDLSKTYDGTPLDAQYVYTDNVLAEGDVLEVNFDTGEAPVTDAGSYVATITDIKVLRGEQRVDVTKGYDILCNVPSGTLTIDKRDITLKTYDATKVYDGTPLTDKRLDRTGEFVTGDNFVITVVGTQTKVGLSDNKCRITPVAATKKDNYNFIEEYGVLQVTVSIAPEFARMYNNSNFVLEASDFTAKLKALSGVSFTLLAENIVWYKKTDSGLFEQCGTGFYYTQDDGSSMTGEYYVSVTVPEVESVMGITEFSSEIVEISGTKAGEVQLKAYSISGQPVGEDYQGVVIYENGFKTIK